MNAELPRSPRPDFDPANIRLVGTAAPSLNDLQALAETVRGAQERKAEAYRQVMRSQNELRRATEALAQAEQDFQAAAPSAFGLGNPVSNDDAIGEWLRTRCRVGGRAETRSSVLYQDFTDWISSTGLFNVERWSLIRFGFALTERGFGTKKLNGGLKVRCGIRLIDEDLADG